MIDSYKAKKKKSRFSTGGLFMQSKQVKRFVSIFLILCSLSIWAGQRVQTCGESIVLNKDRASARRSALLDARTRAIEKAVGIELASETILQNELIVESLLELKTSGHISSERVLSEQQNGELYNVCIEATVEKGKAKLKIKELMGQTRIIVLTEERIDGHLIPQQIVGERLKEKLKKAGFDVLDETHFQSFWLAEHGSNRTSEQEKLMAFTHALLAGLVVVVQADVSPSNTSQSINPYGMKELSKAHAASAFGSIRVFLGDSGLIVAEKSFDRLSGFDTTSLDSASEKALVRAGKDLGQWLTRALTKYLSNHQRKVELIIENTPSTAFVEKVKAALKLHRWANHIQIVEVNKFGRSRLTLSYSDQTIYLAHFLEGLSIPGEQAQIAFPDHTRRGPNILVYQFK
ncbi:MAG: hypothetical protein CR997_02970 [Acidobacteria bacterium]|nr:MAG: hypothetical protein CR997_02970 [Acidobacteriota bacterium]